MRLINIILVLALLAAGIFAVWEAAQPAPRPVRSVMVTIKPLDTAWGLAVKYNPQTDPRTVIEEMERLNGLNFNDTIQQGQVLEIPIFR